MSEILMTRIYIKEDENLLKPLLSYLHDQAKVRGVTVFRGITGFGTTKDIQTNFLVDLSLNLPLVIEFFDEKERVNKAIEHIKTIVKTEHIIFWPAEIS